ncbi:EamA family transporter [Aeromonas veronii]|uniref:EamA family transporter n=1 Tax=Aeromonas TaxID=642 RepID=UPI0003917268|nr:EamA family transporter [Aeromonas veronii]QMS74933.1 EamA family transporter [Aeromonas veronii Hm21]HDO1318136.1 EamA family transporter [Aeromonas veronii]HDO1322573.1 EamA family transporter [Aeromonas veronii]HDO1326837.1 EamA family transporter [Aeromonas veronii]HDO1331627.1 EamA family transporter [Aeromonas veronii]
MDTLLLLLVCILTCSGQMLQKQAVNSWQQRPCSHLQKLRSPWLIASVAALGCGMLLWIYLLQRLPLSMAYPMLSINQVLVLLGSRLFFHEQINYHNWLGVGAIIVGTLLLGGLL